MVKVMFNERPQTSSSDHPKTPVLSLILCSRNDNYMGDSRWRLQTTINLIAQNVHELDREEDVELVVADWGSEVPLHTVLELSPVAARMVSFVIIPPALASTIQRDGPFSEVHALNAAARRINGQFAGRIDQDTFVGKRFLNTFFELYEGTQTLEVPLNSALLFANRRSIPYRFAVRCPSLKHVNSFIHLLGPLLKVNKINPLWPDVFWASATGIWLLHRDVWNECGGYDEKLIYYNSMEEDMILRLAKKYAIVDLGKLVNYDFYHLDHFRFQSPSETTSFSAFSMRSFHGHKTNPRMDLNKPPSEFHPNNEHWGLMQHPLEVIPYPSDRGLSETETLNQPRFNRLSFMLILLSTVTQIVWDGLIGVFLRTYLLWRHRAIVAWEGVRGQPLTRWPRILTSLWNHRQSLKDPGRMAHKKVGDEA